MKYFGDYLIEKKIITEDQLVDALIEQLQMLPSSAEIIYGKKALPASSFLKAFAIQSEKTTDFGSACMAAKIWTTELDQLVQSELDRNRVPLGQILIKKGIVNIGNITKALDDFLSKIELTERKNPYAEIKKDKTNLTDKKPDSVAPPANTDQVDIFLLDEFHSNLSTEKINSIELTLEKIAENRFKPEIKEILKNILSEIHFIRGLLRCIKFERLGYLVEQYEAVCILTLDRGIPAENIDAGKITQMGKNLLEILKVFTSLISVDKKEASVFQDPACSAQYDDLLNRCLRAREEMV